MRTWVKWTSLAAFGLLASSAIAADHGDPTETTGVDASDIADVYAWMTDTDQLTMIMTVTAAELSDGAYYVFNIGRQADGVSGATAWADNANVTKVICWYDTGDQTTCVVDDGSGTEPVASVQGLASDEITDSEGNLRVHVGQHADPFFFYLTGFNQARQEVLDLASALGTPALQLTADGCPQAVELADHPDGGTGALAAGTKANVALLGLLNGTYEDATAWTGDGAGMAVAGEHAADDLETSDVTAIVVELDTALLAGSGDIYQVWGATHVRN